MTNKISRPTQQPRENEVVKIKPGEAESRVGGRHSKTLDLKPKVLIS